MMRPQMRTNSFLSWSSASLTESKLCPELADCVRVFKFVRVRIVAQALQFRQLETALFQKISLAFHCSFASCPLIRF